MFEEDPRFLGVEKDREREELFEDYLVDLDRKVINHWLLLSIVKSCYLHVLELMVLDSLFHNEKMGCSVLSV